MRSGSTDRFCASAPSLGVVNLQIGAAYRNLKDYDKAIAAYNDLLKAEPENAKAQLGIAMANMEKGDPQAAEQVLARAAAGPGSNRDVSSTTSPRSRSRRTRPTKRSAGIRRPPMPTPRGASRSTSWARSP